MDVRFEGSEFSPIKVNKDDTAFILYGSCICHASANKNHGKQVDSKASCLAVVRVGSATSAAVMNATDTGSDLLPSTSHVVARQIKVEQEEHQHGAESQNPQEIRGTSLVMRSCALPCRRRIAPAHQRSVYDQGWAGTGMEDRGRAGKWQGCAEGLFV
jgi:hypothetical protein